MKRKIVTIHTSDKDGSDCVRPRTAARILELLEEEFDRPLIRQREDGLVVYVDTWSDGSRLR